jgi:hypothetical protein
VRLTKVGKEPLLTVVYDADVEILICKDGGYQAVTVSKGDNDWRFVDFHFVGVWNSEGERLL